MSNNSSSNVQTSFFPTSINPRSKPVIQGGAGSILWPEETRKLSPGFIQLAHDPNVIASVIKHFLRNLKPSLFDSLGSRMESVLTDMPNSDDVFDDDNDDPSSSSTSSSIYHELVKIVHSELAQPNRFLLAWILQHINHIVDRSRENLMTLSDIIVVLSPCLGISHRLLSILLNINTPSMADFNRILYI